jgi:hypothetical protein
MARLALPGIQRRHHLRLVRLSTCHWADITNASVYDALVAAGVRVGLPKPEVEAVAAWGLEAGAALPLRIPKR